MKISCQACHSKYNVADDKVQGKIVKIRCRKCGATIVVNASSGAANGAVPAPAPAPAANATGGSEATGGGSASADEWHVSVSDNDQRTMTLAELVNAYNANVIAQETYVWTEGMQDWKPLGEVDAVVAALHTAAGQTAAAAVGAYGAGGAPAPVASSPAYDAPAPVYERPAAIAAPAAPTPVQEPKRAAVGRREARARDLFATRTGEELQTGGLTGDDSRLTGQRNENSVLFSLEHLSKSADERPAQQPLGAAQNDDSGVIDLKALAAKAESMRPQKTPDLYAPAPPLGFAPPQFSAPIGGFGPLGSDAPRSSRLPLLIGAGAGIAVLLVLGIVIGLKIGGSSAGPSAAATAFQLPASVPTAITEPVPTATTSATAQASATASGAVAVKPRAFGAGAAHPAGAGIGFKPLGGAGGGGAAGGGATGGTAGGGAAAGGGGGGGTPPAAAAPKKNDCGCNGDLMCMMKCSTH